MMGYKKWILFVIVVIGIVVSQVFLQQRYTTLLQSGKEYQWPVTLSASNQWIPADYLTVHFQGTRTMWTGEKIPAHNEYIYVSVSAQPNGLLMVQNASDVKPPEGEYILARMTSFENGIVDFKIPFDRVPVNVNKVNPAFYKNYKGPLTATLKLKDGKAVVTGVYSKGVSIEMAQPDFSGVDKGGILQIVPAQNQTEPENEAD